MTTEMLDKAINGIRPELIEEAADINTIIKGKAENPDTIVLVQGVEAYHRPVWRKLLATASALILVFGAVAGGAFIMKNRTSKPANTVTDTTSVQQETEMPTPAEAEEATEASNPEATADISDIEPEFIELQLHEAPHYAETYEEARVLADEHSINIPWNERHKYRVDTKHYAELLQSDGYDINSLEAKSYIYHMMLNSYLYYDTAKGTMILPYSNDLSHYTTIDFQDDFNNQESYNKCSNYTDVVSENFISSEKVINKIYNGNNYTVSPNDWQYEIKLTEDNYRYIDVAPPDYGFSICIWNACMGIEFNILMPDQIALPWLMRFENWRIDSISERIGRTVAELSGVNDKGNDFTLAVDIYTGILIEYTVSSNGTVIDYLKTTDLQVDIPVEHTEPDLTDFTKIDLFKQ
ncbi:hypothetical protein SAMN02910265_01833 [Ruminococcus flavefaciens]|uniref:Uncharacterized protein n=1 Tax=Ruminococcus flavefaciens TaxID=1265 RepID=A0A1H6JNQ3_RUMFL|nr:hypothetical protein [Ruminococcus flavefaciens]SEH62494.1 hypothetical protein SAMN02910265_01833 [Ruminococcus flavefaciens]